MSADPKQRDAKSATPNASIESSILQQQRQQRAVSASPASVRSSAGQPITDRAGPTIRVQSRVVTAVATPSRRRRDRKRGSHVVSAKNGGWIGDQSPENKKAKRPPRTSQSSRNAKSKRKGKSRAEMEDPVTPLIGALPPEPIFDPQKVNTVVLSLLRGF